MDKEMSPEESVFRGHIERGPFQSGVARGRWRLISIEWPFSIIAVAAAHRSNGPAEYFLRFDLTNYPQWAPTACPWNVECGAPLEASMRPHGKSRVDKAFRTDWKKGVALYLPCDREAIEGHDAWRTQHPSMLWNPNGDITQYLKIVYDLLNSNDYTGPRGS
jgi:hypothetical protein